MPSHGQDVHTVSLNKYTTEYDKVSKQFYATAKGVTISKIERIQNPWLYQSYILSKEKMEKNNGTSNERLLFHATSFHCVKSINSSGFKRNLNAAHGEYINRFAPELPLRIRVPFSACDVISFKRSFKPCWNEHNSVKDSGFTLRGHEDGFTHIDFLWSLHATDRILPLMLTRPQSSPSCLYSLIIYQGSAWVMPAGRMEDERLPNPSSASLKSPF